MWCKETIPDEQRRGTSRERLSDCCANSEKKPGIGNAGTKVGGLLRENSTGKSKEAIRGMQDFLEKYLSLVGLYNVRGKVEM